MTRRLLAVLSLLMLFVAAALAAEAWKVEPQGAGTVRVGMKEAEVRKALGGTITEEEGDSEHCYYLESDRHPLLAFMISHGTMTGVTVTDPGVFTAEGAQVGDTEAAVKKIYGDRMKVEPRPDKNGNYLTVLTPDGKFGTRFITDGSNVTGYYAGTANAIVHGCV